MTTTTNYIPGVCNINPMEIRRRRFMGHIGLIVTIVVVIALVFIEANWYVRLIVFAPLLLAASGYLQAKNKFCTGYAGAGKQHADDNENAEAIEDKTALHADKLRARMINIQAFLIAAIATTLFCIIPL